MPEGKRLGHAGAIVEGSRSTAESKIKALTEAGVKGGAVPSDLVKLIKEMIYEALPFPFGKKSEPGETLYGIANPAFLMKSFLLFYMKLRYKKNKTRADSEFLFVESLGFQIVGEFPFWYSLTTSGPSGTKRKEGR